MYSERKKEKANGGEGRRMLVEKGVKNLRWNFLSGGKHNTKVGKNAERMCFCIYYTDSVFSVPLPWSTSRHKNVRYASEIFSLFFVRFWNFKVKKRKIWVQNTDKRTHRHSRVDNHSARWHTASSETDISDNKRKEKKKNIHVWNFSLQAPGKWEDDFFFFFIYLFFTFCFFLFQWQFKRHLLIQSKSRVEIVRQTNTVMSTFGRIQTEQKPNPVRKVKRELP